MSPGACSSHPLRRLRLLVELVLLSKCVWAQKSELPAGRYITQVDYPSVRYQGLVASFGNPLRDDMKINLMLPPDHQNDPYLCSFPASLNSTSADSGFDIKTRAANISEPVGLLVAVGGPCSTEHKARIMLQMQTAVSKYLKVLILYETDRKYASWFISLAPDSPEVAPELENVGILYFPFRHVPKMKGQLNRVGKGNPLLLQPDNDLWSFEHNIEGFWVPIDPGDARPGDVNAYEFDAGNDLYWIRYVLFSLLILSPCFRAAYLFHSGGGRFRFRRNEGGRVVGFQYTPPMAHWLSHGRAPQALEPTSRPLTEDQFKSLPEIIYAPLPEEEDEEMDDSDDEADESELIPSDPELGSSLPGEPKPADDTLPLSKEVGSSNKEDLKSSSRVDITSSGETESTPSVSGDSNHRPCPMATVCRWSECSICICDFEMGDLLIVLPRCQHVFHKDCIRPWLMERQGRCPLCKKCALGDNDQSDDSEQSESSSEGRGSEPSS